MDITKIWAKTAPKKSLINHMLETGIVAGCLTDTNGIYHPVLNRLSEITGCDSDTLLAKIVFICAIHDIGKIHPTFQGRDEETLEVLRQESLNQMSFDTRFKHEQYGANIFDRLSVEDVDIKNSDIISQIIRMHHQKEQKKNSDIDIIKIDDKEKAKKCRHIQNEIYDYIKNVFRFDNLNLINKNISKSELFVVQNAILGIMITADWIASNSYVFDNQQYENVDEFLESRKTQALKFLNNEGMIRQQIPVMQNFRSTFGFNGRPVQNDVEKIVHKNDIKCMLIESDCGSGKTEAALSAGILLAMCAAGVYNYSYVEGGNELSDMRNTEVYNSEIQHIADVCAKDTMAIGFFIPMVYYELGWDSGYYFIDFADLDVYPQSLEYLQNELDNIDEPIIMDYNAHYTLTDKGVNLDKFYERFELSDEFTVGSAVLEYWVPVN